MSCGAGKISIIIPLYNRKDTIEETLDSCFSQDYSASEVIVVDDGSTDDAESLIREKYKDVIYFRQTNQGAPAARNKGIEISTGDYLIFLDAGDMLVNGVIGKLAEKVGEDVDLVIGNCCKVYPNGKEKPIKIVQKEEILCGDECLKQCCLAPSPICKLYKKEFLIRNGIYFENLAIGQDLNFHIKYLLNCEKVYLLPECIGVFTIVEGGISRQYTIKIAEIVESFSKLAEYASRDVKLAKRFDKIRYIEYYHIFWQMIKVPVIREKSDKEIVFDKLKDEFDLLEERLSHSSNVYDKKYYSRVRIICKLRSLWTSMAFGKIYAFAYNIKTLKLL